MNADREPQGQPKGEATAAIDQVFQSWAEVPAEPLPGAAEVGPPPASAEDRPMLVLGGRRAGTPPALPLNSDYVRELQAEFEEQEEGGKLR